METVRFYDGSIYNCPAVFADGAETAFIILDGVTLVEAAQIATDESKTQEFEWGGKRFVGYTNCQGVSVKPNGAQLILKGGRFE